MSSGCRSGRVELNGPRAFRYWLPRSEWKIKPGAGWRLNRAMRSASVTRLACMCGCMLQPTTWRLNRSITAARYSQPSSVAM